MELVTLFYLVDEFCKQFEPEWRARQIESGERVRNKPGRMSLSEVMTICIWFHASSQTPPACRWLAEWGRLKGDRCPAVLV